MSRRGRYGRQTSQHPAARSPRPASAAAERPITPTAEGRLPSIGGPSAEPSQRAPHRPDAPVVEATEQPVAASASAAEPSAPPVPMAPPEASLPAKPADREREHLRPRLTGDTPAPGSMPLSGGDALGRAGSRPANGGEEPRPGCTTAQLRRFIKSRPWVPMHELRRRFAINGGDDDVTPIRVAGERLYIGLPPAEGNLMAELLGGGDVGYELSLDPGAPVVVGVYPMRPVPRS